MSYDIDPETGRLRPEYCDVFGIPFEVIPVQGTQPNAAPQPPPSVLVEALPERAKDFLIEFPRVEGYVYEVRQRIRCDVDRVPPLLIEPQIEPTAVEVRSQAGVRVQRGQTATVGASETVTRERFYEEHRIQRTAFEIARDITEIFAKGRGTSQPAAESRQYAINARLVFPQILAVVGDFIERKVNRASPSARPEEIALPRYREAIIDRLVAAIEPVLEEGEATLRPRVERHRPIGDTSEVQFRSTKPVKETQKSHVSHVVLDSTWEGSAAFFLERSPRVRAYVKNDRLGFEILYDWQGKTHPYLPDFLARMDDGSTWIVEIKGELSEQDRQKKVAAEKWVRAVNNHGGFGKWEFRMFTDAHQIGRVLRQKSESSS